MRLEDKILYTYQTEVMVPFMQISP